MRMKLINNVIMSDMVPTGLRSKVLRRLGIALGADTYLASRTMFKGTTVTTGVSCFVNHGCHFDRGRITLGDGVYIGPNVIFVSNDHLLGDMEKRAGANIERPIIIGSGAWIGARAVILGGVTVAPGCVIGAGAVVTKGTKANGVYVGIPAKRVKDLPGSHD